MNTRLREEVETSGNGNTGNRPEPVRDEEEFCPT